MTLFPVCLVHITQSQGQMRAQFLAIGRLELHGAKGRSGLQQR